MEKLQIPFICSECKRNFVLNNNVVKKLSVIIDGEMIDLTYFDCECGKRYFVQVDNDETRSILRRIIAVVAVISGAKSEGKSVKRKYSARYKVLSGKLKRRRFELMKKYEGKAYFDSEKKENVEIHFSV
jgi:hypothetical protein